MLRLVGAPHLPDDTRRPAGYTFARPPQPALRVARAFSHRVALMNSSLAAGCLRSLYLHHHGSLRLWLRRKLRCPDRAADLTHDTFLRLLARPRMLDAGRDPTAYLRRIARGLMIDQWRREQIERAWLETLAGLPVEQVPSPEHQALVLEALCRIDRLLDQMAPRPRQAFLLAQLQGMGQAEIARELEVSERMVRKYLSQAMLHCLTFDAQERD